MRRNTALDGLRGAAALGVVIIHLDTLVITHGLYLSLDIFFVLSGYLITSGLLKEHDGGGISLTKFYRRRLVRIYPPLIFALIIILPSVVISGYRGYLRDCLLAITHSTNLYTYFVYPKDRLLLGHTWSLAVEEHYYLLWPLLCVVIGRRWGVRSRFMKAAIIAIAVVSCSTLIVQDLMSAPDPRLPGITVAYFHSEGRAFEFMLGSSLGIGSNSRRVLQHAERLAVCAAAGLLGVMLAAAYWPPHMRVSLAIPLAAVLTTVLIGSLEHSASSIVGRILNLRMLRMLGREDVPSLVELGWRSEMNSMRRLRQFRGSRPTCLRERGGAGRRRAGAFACSP